MKMKTEHISFTAEGILASEEINRRISTQSNGDLLPEIVTRAEDILMSALSLERVKARRDMSPW
jgi:hypothetical protein